MQFTTILLFIGSVYAASCSILSPKGCTEMITKDIYDIGNQTRNIGCIAAAIEPNCVFTMLKLHSATNDLVETMRRVSHAVNLSCPSLELADSLPLVPAFQTMIPSVTRTMEILKNKVDIFEHALFGVISLSKVVYSDLGLVLDSSNQMALSIRGKVPVAAQSIVDNLTKQLVDPIKATRRVYS